MVDRLAPARRSWLMSRVRSKNTGPEILVRKLVHGLGYRYRLHGNDLPGKPDLVLRRLHTVIFVHGCFWHRHPKCRKATNPTTRVEFWNEKFARNIVRDAENLRKLRKQKWRVIVVWECETKNAERLGRRLARLLDRPTP